ncbi:hypothetical protein LIER_39184 [Lithospermum erythrorhizon]|uniref:Uncharacterized protein n=1 Tax=Lithospermum erythrorhizon TaxID=34254 RepID=A0AAV3QAS9_LITER
MTISLKQEETRGDIFKEIDNYPSGSTGANQAIIAGSSTQSAEPLAEGGILQSVGEEGEDSDDIPLYIANALRVPFTDSQLWDLKEYFPFRMTLGLGFLLRVNQ